MLEPVVFLPDMMCDARLFGPQIAELSATRCITVAPLTHGERIEEIASHILACLPARFAVVGSGFGGIVAMELLRRVEKRITRLALFDTTPLAETPLEAAKREPQIVGARAGRLEQIIHDEFARPLIAPGTYSGEVLDLVLHMALTLGPDVFLHQSRAMQRRRDQQATLRKCKVPTVILCGEMDQSCPVKRHTFMAELIPYAEFVVLKNTGHYPSLEAPDEVAQVLHAWLDLPAFQ